MTEKKVLTKENFDALLAWFSPDREQAGAKYEEIRSALVRFFYVKGCADAEVLTDEAFNRVALKLDSLNTDNSNKHITYFYGFASKIYLEYRSRVQYRLVPFEAEIHDRAHETIEVDEDDASDQSCLLECLERLPSKERQLAVAYFQKEKGEKIRYRREIAEGYGLTPGALHVRIHRLKSSLRKCIEGCVALR